MKQEKKLTYEQTKEKALRLLDFRSHSEAELKKKLEVAGGTEIDAVLDFCRKYKFVNDEVYAKRLAKDLANLKKFGKRRIKEELLSRGIDLEFVENAMAELEFDETAELLPLMEKKLKNNFEKKNIDKAIRYFLYRGYGFSDINKCIEQIKQNGEDYGI